MLLVPAMFPGETSHLITVFLFVYLSCAYGLSPLIRAELYMSPQLDMRDEGNTISTGIVKRLHDCVILCMDTPLCVAFNLGVAGVDGQMQCELKDHLLVVPRYLINAPGESYYRFVPPLYNRTGCFLHQTRETFDLISALYRGPTYNNWQPEDFAQMIVGCAGLAWRRGYGVFGVEYWGECYGKSKDRDYTIDGPMPEGQENGCVQDIGGDGQAISVFEFL